MTILGRIRGGLENIVEVFFVQKDPYPKSNVNDIEYKLKVYLHNLRKGEGDRTKLYENIESYLLSLKCKDKKLFGKYNEKYSEYREMYG